MRVTPSPMMVEHAERTRRAHSLGRTDFQPIQGEHHGLSTRRVSGTGRDAGQRAQGLDKSHYLYIAVIAAVSSGPWWLLFPEFAKSLKPLGDGFIKLIKMMIGPVIFCTIVLGIGSIAKAATVGKVGGLALGYFMVMSTFALAIGLVVGNLIHPGEGLKLDRRTTATKKAASATAPSTSCWASSRGDIPGAADAPRRASCVGFALQKMGPQGAPILKAIGHGQAPRLPHPHHDHVAGPGRRLRCHRRRRRRHRLSRRSSAWSP